jgi:hypothetical protein
MPARCALLAVPQQSAFLPTILTLFSLQGKCQHVVHYLQYRWGNTPTNTSSRLFCQPYLLSPRYKGNASTLCTACSTIGEAPQPTHPVGFFANHTYSLPVTREMPRPRRCALLAIPLGKHPNQHIQSAFFANHTYLLPCKGPFPLTREIPTRCVLLAVPLGKHPNQQVQSAFCQPYLVTPFPLQGKYHQ